VCCVAAGRPNRSSAWLVAAPLSPLLRLAPTTSTPPSNNTGYPTQLSLNDDRVLHVGGYASEADPPVPAIEVWDGRVKRVTTIFPEPFLQQLGAWGWVCFAPHASALLLNLWRLTVRFPGIYLFFPIRRRPEPVPHNSASALDQRTWQHALSDILLQPRGESLGVFCVTCHHHLDALG